MDSNTLSSMFNLCRKIEIELTSKQAWDHNDREMAEALAMFINDLLIYREIGDDIDPFGNYRVSFEDLSKRIIEHGSKIA